MCGAADIDGIHAMKRRLVHCLVVFSGIAIAGCAADRGSANGPAAFAADAQWQRINPGMLQQDLMSFSDRFGTATADAYDLLADSATSYEAKRMAMGRKTGTLMAAVNNAVNENPIVGLMDMLVLVTLVRQSSEDLWFTNMFGDDAAKTVAVLRAQENDVWSVASRYFTPSQLAELRAAIDRWRRDNPDQRYVAMVRLSDFPGARSSSGTGSKTPGSIFGLLFMDPFSSLDPAVREVERSRETVERMFYYMRRMPWMVSWETEAMSNRALGAPPIRRFLEDTSRFTAATTRFADAAHEVPDSINKFPQFLTEERQRAVEQLSQKVAEQRDAAVRQATQAVAAERDAAIRQLNDAVTVQRDAAMRQVAGALAAERDASLAGVNTLVQSQRERLALDVDAATTRLVNRLFWAQIEVVVTAVVLTTIALLAYRRLCPANRPLSEDSSSDQSHGR
jgi:hypothetical protein